MNRPFSDRRGFSLVEVIIAIAILGFSLLAIIPLLSTSLSVNTETTLTSSTQMLGAELINTLQTWPENDIRNSNCLNLGNGQTCTWDTKILKGTTITRSYRFDTTITGSVEHPSDYLITVFTTYPYKGMTIRRVFTAPWRRQ